MAEIQTDACSAGRATSTVITNVANWILELKSQTSDNNFIDSATILKLLSAAYEAHCTHEALQNEIVTVVDSHEGTDVFVRIISILSELKELSDDQEACIHKCYCILWDFSDTHCGGKFVQNLINTCIVGQCIENLKQNKQQLSEKTRKDIIKASLGILYNISRETNAESLLQGVDWTCLLPFKEGNDEYLKAMSAMILAFISDEKTDGIRGEKETTEYMLKLLQEAKDSQTRRKQGFTCTELIQGLGRLSLNDLNKERVLQAGGVSLLMEFVEGNDLSEQEAAATCLWTLAFLDSATVELNKYDRQLHQIVTSNKSEKLTKAIKGILLTLQSEEDSECSIVADSSGLSSETKGEHIMISYSWDGGYGQRTARKIAAHLKSRGFKVWIDIDEMKGSVLDAMADAVNNSYLFVLCVSNAYRKSNNCRLEAKYAYTSKKLILPVLTDASIKSRNDWLKLLCSDKMYIEFKNENAFYSNCDDLVRQVLRLTKEHDEVDARHSRLRRSNTLTVQPTSSDWECDDVSTWLIDNDLHSLAESFHGIDGSLIEALGKLRREAPEFFYRTLWELDGEAKRKKFVNLLKLSKALDNLQWT